MFFFFFVPFEVSKDRKWNKLATRTFLTLKLKMSDGQLFNDHPSVSKFLRTLWSNLSLICRPLRGIRDEQKSEKWGDIPVDVQRGREGGYFRERDLRRGRAGNLLQTFRVVEVRGVRREEPGSRQEAQHHQHTRLEPWKVVAEPHPGQGGSLRVRHYSSRPETGTWKRAIALSLSLSFSN